MLDKLEKVAAPAAGAGGPEEDAAALAALAAHVDDPTGAHAATAVSVDPTGLDVVTSDDVQGALGELDAAVSSGASAEDVTYDNTDSELDAGTVQEAIDEVAQFRVLAEVRDNDATYQLPNAPVGKANIAAVDAARLPAVTFDFPASGEVVAEFSAFALAERTSTATFLMWGLLEAGVLVPNSIVAAIASADNGIAVYGGVTRRVRLTGTPGETKTWTWGHYVNTANGIAQTQWGGAGAAETIAGQASMRVMSVPLP